MFRGALHACSGQSEYRLRVANTGITSGASMQQLYPFPAVLGGDPDAPDGLDDMALALVLSAISPVSAGC